MDLASSKDTGHQGWRRARPSHGPGLSQLTLQERVAATLGSSLNVSEGHTGIAGCQEPTTQNRAHSGRTEGPEGGGGTQHREQRWEDKETRRKQGPPVGVEEDIDERRSNGWQRLWVQCEDTEAVLWALNGMHGGAGPC